MPTRSSASKSAPTIATTPAIPTKSPRDPVRVMRSEPPVASATSAPTSGVAAISRAASELDTCCSAEPSITQGIAISIDREDRQPAPAGEDGSKVDAEERDRQQDHHRDRRPGEHERRGADLLDGDPDQQVGNTPDDRHEAEEHEPTTRHAGDGRTQAAETSARRTIVAA